MQSADRIDQVFCLPYAGGSSMIFTKWPVPPGAPRWQGLDYPAHLLTLRQPPAASIEELAAAMAAKVLERAAGPYALFGVSMGALVAYEAALLAEAAGRGPELLVLAACLPPDRLLPHPGYRLSGIEPDDAMLAAFAARYQGMDEQALGDPRIRELVLPVLRADVRLYEEYGERHAGAPARPVAADLLLIGGTGDTAVPLAELACWREHGTGAAELLEFEGDHFFVDKRAPELVAELTARLRRRSVPVR
ncbi:thioesterase II family protein [Kitasatospora viridis]|uniref:Surfactin synthase thioesterase subunit n=1 Tax=Kitasatospora viridis TaxID=281105 RepID=A0A561UBX3_9ACTN|nr:alpha/beta fold hydrolase [Kitasatospora viridis]TWF96863.1 surfactin synthase thioesterase subunit [Kitasatospora viridis]